MHIEEGKEIAGYSDMEAANNAWSEQRYEDAIELWTEAIELTSDDDLLKVLFSNRSAAYSK
jgi:hypothetical protein